MKSIALTGKKRAGKDTVADVLVKEYGYVRVAFADPLKAMALEIDPVVTYGANSRDGVYLERLSGLIETFGWEQTKEHFPEVRRYLQSLGSSIRKRDPLFWIMAAADKIFEAQKAGKPVVVTDVRYENEAQFLTKEGFSLVRVTRPGVDDGDTHESETEMDGYPVDLTIWNDGPLSKIQNSARCLTL